MTVVICGWSSCVNIFPEISPNYLKVNNNLVSYYSNPILLVCVNIKSLFEANCSNKAYQLSWLKKNIVKKVVPHSLSVVCWSKKSMLLWVPDARLAVFECGLWRAGHTVHMQINLQTTNYTETSSNKSRPQRRKPAIAEPRVSDWVLIKMWWIRS